MPPLQRLPAALSEDSEHSQIDVAAPPPETKDATTTSKSVRFGSIQIREYNCVVGDHPDVQVGPPMSIGWDYVEHDAQCFDQYESERTKPVLRRMSSITRKNLLKNVFEISEEEIRAAEKEVQAILKSRQRTKQRQGAVKKYRRKIKKVLLGESLMRGLMAAAGSMMTPMGPGGSMTTAVY